MIAPSDHIARLIEPPIAGDVGSAVPGALPAYNVYGADGDVTAQVVYVNFGMDADYQELARRGISVTGKIALAPLWWGLARAEGEAGTATWRDRVPHLLRSA